MAIQNLFSTVTLTHSLTYSPLIRDCRHQQQELSRLTSAKVLSPSCGLTSDGFSDPLAAILPEVCKREDGIDMPLSVIRHIWMVALASVRGPKFRPATGGYFQVKERQLTP